MNPYLKAAVSIWALAVLLIWFDIAEAGYDFSDSTTWTNAQADDDTTALVIDATPFKFSPATSISFTSPDGRTATIDFGGDEVVYSGDLPVAEGAKLFFDAAHGLCGCRNKITKGEKP